MIGAPPHAALPFAAEDSAVKQEAMVQIHQEREFKVDRTSYQGVLSFGFKNSPECRKTLKCILKKKIHFGRFIPRQQKKQFRISFAEINNPSRVGEQAPGTRTMVRILNL